MRSAEEQLEKLAKELKDRFFERCSGTGGHVGVHRAAPGPLQEIEDIEEGITRLELKS